MLTHFLVFAFLLAHSPAVVGGDRVHQLSFTSLFAGTQFRLSGLSLAILILKGRKSVLAKF